MFDQHQHQHQHQHQRDLTQNEAESSKPKTEDNPEDHQITFSQKGSLSFLKDQGFHSPSTSKQELTLSYLCDNNNNMFCLNKGKEPALSSSSNQQQQQQQPNNSWVERDFLNLNHNSSKRLLSHHEEDVKSLDKKPKLETLNLSLALLSDDDNNNNNNNNNENDNDNDDDVSLSLTAKQQPSTSNNNNTSFSNDFTTYSYSYSHQVSHNPSCSMTCNSTDFGSDTRLWCGGEGTNGSVHSRFRPLADGLVAFNNNSNNNPSSIMMMMQGNNKVNNPTTSDNISFFPSELPARPGGDNNNNNNNNNNDSIKNVSGDLRRRESESLRVAGIERILREIISESVPVVSQIFQELSDEIFESVKEYLKNVFMNPENREELLSLQNRIERRADLTKESLAKCHKGHLEILTAIKTGLDSFISGKTRLSGIELVEIFLFMRCKNVNCRNLLPVDDCDCKICSANKGFCSSCMCPVCLNFDCASNTCTWVGCDVCSHWCHAVCGIQKNLIKPGQSLKGPPGSSEMQFHCIACGHSSEMFGFVKDVFMCCAKDWGLETLKKELDCVRKIFKGSDDVKGKELRSKADIFLSKLERNMMSTSDACKLILSFFDYLENMPLSASVVSSKVTPPTQAVGPTSQSSFLPPKYSVYNTSSSTSRPELLSNNPRQNDLKSSTLLGNLKYDESLQFGKLPKKDNGVDSLESLVRIKDAEARMFQNKADQARREAESLMKMIRLKSDQLEEEYTGKISKLSLEDAEGRRKKKLDELKLLENSHCDYYNMKLRMQSDIAGLMERMKTTKQQLV